MWNQEDITENDRIITTVEYKGEKCEADTVVVATSGTASVLLNAITRKTKPLGNIIVTEYTVFNALEYALEKAEPQTTFLRNARFSVTKINDIILIDIKENPLPHKKVADKILEITKPKNVIALRSVHCSLFNSKEAKIASIFTLSNDQSKSNFPAPNTISGVAASLMIQSQLIGTNCTIYTVIEEDAGTSVETLTALHSTISDIVKCEGDIPNIAYDLYELRNNDLGMIYS